MNAARFDRLTHMVRDVSSRRGLLRGLAGAFGLAAIKAPDAMEAKDKKKLKQNEYGCVNVEGQCRGKNKNCCSGICEGKKPKRGERDRSRCKVHDTGVLEAGAGGCRAQDESISGDVNCTTSAGEEDGLCWRTTGNAGHCGYGSACIPCRQDTDCIGACGAGAACVVVPNACAGAGVVCSGAASCDAP